MQKAEWIWYPGDYEIFITQPLLFRRDYRGVFQSPFWRIDRWHQNVHYSRQIETEKEQNVKIFARGLVEVRTSLVPNMPLFANSDGEYVFPVGNYTVSVSVYSEQYLPAIFVLGESVFSDSSWTVSTDKLRGDYYPVGFNGFFDCATFPGDNLFVLSQLKPKEIIYCGKSLVYDFGRELFGYVQIEGIKTDGDVSFYYGESLEESLDTEHCETLDLFHVQACDKFCLERSRGFRYVQVRTEVIYSEISVLAEEIPFSFTPEFVCENEKINRIYKTALYTFQLNCREAFLDGIKRDRWYWGGDAFQCCLIDYYSFFDKDIVRRTLGALIGQFPFERHINHIPDYTFLWFISFSQYYHFTGDRYLIDILYRKAKAMMRYCLASLSENGFIEKRKGDWIFIDWTPMDKEGALSAEQILFYTALKSFADIAREVGDSVECESLHCAADKLKQRVMNVFWDDKKCLFRHNAVGGIAKETITAYANIFAILFDFCPDYREKLSCAVLQEEGFGEVVTPYAKFYQLSMYGEIGRNDLIVKEIENYWGDMIDLGVTTFWELYDSKAENHYEMYGRPFGKSLCHAWGASPLYLISKYILGLRPTEMGYQTYEINPDFSCFQKIHCKLPLPDGFIQVERNANKITIYSHSKKRGILLINPSYYINLKNEDKISFSEGKTRIELKPFKKTIIFINENKEC